MYCMAIRMLPITVLKFKTKGFASVKSSYLQLRFSCVMNPKKISIYVKHGGQDVTDYFFKIMIKTSALHL